MNGEEPDCDYDKRNVSVVICDTDIMQWLTKDLGKACPCLQMLKYTYYIIVRLIVNMARQLIGKK